MIYRKKYMVIAIILAAGNSLRFGKEDKLLQPLIGQETVLEKTISVFEHSNNIDKIILVGESEEKFLKKFSKISVQISGGSSRFESFVKALEFCRKNFPSSAKILVTNGANPFVKAFEIDSVLSSLAPNTAVAVGRKISNTVRKKIGGSSSTIARENLFSMETPQGAFLEDFLIWIEKNSDENITDELSLAEKNGGETVILPACEENRKITIPEDMNPQFFMPIASLGIDSHRFDEHSTSGCILCGVEVENTPKFLANSDGDVALHALCNALLSGIGANSFSCIADSLCENGEKNSAVYLQKVLEKVEKEQKKVLHISLCFEGKRPKLERHFTAFRKNLSTLLFLPESAIGLNATTGEGLDGYGKGEGLKVTALVTMA